MDYFSDEWRRKRLSELADYKGGRAALGRFLGYKDGAYIRQMIDGERPITEKTIQAIHEKPGLAGWFDKPSSNVAPAAIGARSIPLISYVQAGCWTDVVDSFAPGAGDEYLLTDLELSSSAFALKIKGDSMLPEFKEGDRVIIDPAVSPLPGDYVVAKNGDEEATFKKYRPRGTTESGQPVFELVPLNEDYETLRSDRTPIRIVGTMVEHRKYRRR